MDDSTHNTVDVEVYIGLNTLFTIVGMKEFIPVVFFRLRLLLENRLKEIDSSLERQMVRQNLCFVIFLAFLDSKS